MNSPETMTVLWNKDQEKDFFLKSLNTVSPQNLFYLTNENKNYAYWPKNYDGEKYTLQGRNSLIGSYSEKWTTDLFEEIAEKVGGFSVQGVKCEEIGLPANSPADVAICKTKDVVQSSQNILMILEVKISIVWNWELIYKESGNIDLVCIGDYKTHRGTPSLLRSDTILKAIGKTINIRLSSVSASQIPIVIIGNTPIKNSHYTKVDNLKRYGIIQGFWSVNSNPLNYESADNIKASLGNGFYKFDNYDELSEASLKLLTEERGFFSSMQTRRRLGKIIETANQELTYEAKAQNFLRLLREPHE